MNKKVVWGIDIAGRTGNNGVAKGEFEGSTLEITIYTNNGFTVKKGRDYDYAEDIFTKILRSNSILVIDTALDLQKLGNWKELFEKIKENWEEVKRPIDYAYKGLTPLADLFGAGVVRTHRFLSSFDKNWQNNLLGTSVYETYPAAILRELSEKSNLEVFPTGYKGKVAVLGENSWQGEPEENNLARSLNSLGFKADFRTTLNDDEFDAALCVWVYFQEFYNREKLSDRVIQRIKRLGETKVDDLRAPKGYLLPERLIPNVEIIIKKTDACLLDEFGISKK